MPTYSFNCEACGEFDVLRSISRRDEPCNCPACESPAQRVISSPTLFAMSTALRTAHATNERARHEPKKSSSHVHGPGCGCGSKISKSTVKAADGSKTFPSKRPWMISH